MDTLGIMQSLMEYIPEKLKENELKVVLYLIRTPKAAKIMVILWDKKSSYLNKIQKIVGGSKSNTIETLKSLEELKIIKTKWTVTELKGRAVPKTRAVKAFLLNDDKKKLIEFYEPFLRKI